MGNGKIKYPAKVRVGYALLRVGSITLFFFAAAIAALFALIFALDEFATVYSTPQSIVTFALDIVIIFFYIGAGIAGLNFAAHRKFLVWMVAFAAFFFLFIFLYRTIEIVVKFVEGRGQTDEIVEIVLTFLTQTIYFVGWHLSKDYFED